MKKKILIGSIIAVAVIVLSSFSTVVSKVSSDNELVDFEVEFCGLGNKHTVQLTQQEADEVELLFDDIEQRLSEVETREEAVVIYNEAIIELDKFGLLGKLSIEKAKNLVTGRYLNNRFTKLLEERYLPIQENSEDIENYLCLVAGCTTNTFIYTLPILSTFFIFIFFNLLESILPSEIILTFLANLLNLLLDYSTEYKLIYFRNPIAYNYPGAEGWIYSIGIKGIQSINGTMRGTLFDRTDIRDLWFSIIGFKGIKICMNYPFDTFYMGHALALKIEHINPKEV